ncbi:zinc finger protein RFP-like isoform X3 [Python bivittatus]|uniref:Zinc finger protein RFP-like isoform X1 n=1 Tax=Python bivittatus TaxID=176946 RepID=A0A9F2REF8_PYTBI|nr:zinc finger protein RFP-like isoform X1 [Python bivittatus]XP_025032922.1 zinc finger protein RFP-like isoform X2 [Python bivittatus]XP_025032923.1 zinc finger protein RFP-like isoform X3 [Python bivittatus]
MAAGAPVLDLLEEATCPLCLEYFPDPVLIPECGHNFCRSCLTRSWGESPSEASCPQCRRTFCPRNILANRQLARVVEIAQRCDPRGEEGGSFCRMHREPLKLFCQDHETLICVVCDRAREHRDHRVTPLEEVALQEYRSKVGDCLKAQKEEKEKILTYRRETERKMEQMLDLIKKERENTVAEFRELRRCLEEQEKLLLARMEETEKEIMAIRDKWLAKHIEELSSLEDLIQEIEEKLQWPASKLLQDIGSVLEKYQAKKPSKIPVAFPLELKWRIWDYSDISVFLKGIMKQFRDNLEFGLQLQKVNVILDPDTAHPGLVLSEDRKSIRAVDEDQCLPKNPERFENWLYVLGCQGFSTGRHFWEVTVGKKEEWYVGVAKKSVNRKDYIEVCPEEGIWEVGKWEGKYRANFPPKYPTLVPTEELKSIRISLNCEGGQVTFFDAQTAALLYTFSEAPLAGETLLPSFSLNNDDCLTLSP